MKFGAAVIIAILLATGLGASAEQVPSDPPVAQPTPPIPQKELPAERTVTDQHKAVRKQAPKRQGDQGPAGVPAVPVQKVETVPLTPPGKQADDDKKNAPVPSVLDFFTPSGWNEISAYCASRPEGAPDKWLHEKFICDIRGTDVAVAIFAGMLFVATVVLTLVGLAQWGVASRTAQRQLRAYISVRVSGDFPPIWSPTDGISVTLDVHNAGETPAHGVINLLSVGHSTYPLNAPLPEPDEGPNPATASLGPKATLQIEGDRPGPLSEEIATHLRNGTLRIYVFGEIRYRDAFRVRRYTRFCITLPVEMDGSIGKAQYYATGNKST